ncbi:hypothetical protein ACFQ4K_16460 [Tistrella bauzanensis]
MREPSSVTRQLFLKAADTAGIPIRMAASLGSREMIREATAAGLGYGIVFDGELGRDNRLKHRPSKATAWKPMSACPASPTWPTSAWSRLSWLWPGG